MKLISWNIASRADAWPVLLDSGADVALLQEAAAPPAAVKDRVLVDQEPWSTAGAGFQRAWRTAVVRLNDGLSMEWLRLRPLSDATGDELGVSRPGTLAAARVTMPDGQPLTVVSMYGLWERPLESTGSGWIYADASVHRLISDLSALIGREKGHRIIAAGDLNILHGYGEDGSPYWAERYRTIFDRMRALGLLFVGPQWPNGRRAEPWPRELPADSANVPTFHTNKMTVAQAQRQLDFVFASAGLADKVQVRALNEVEEWGPSDHCRIEIEVR